MEYSFFSILISLVGVGFIFLGTIITREKYNHLISGYSKNRDIKYSKKSLFSIKLLLFTIGTSIIIGFGILISLGYTLYGILITFNVIFIAIIIHVLSLISYVERNQKFSMIIIASVLSLITLFFNYQIFLFTSPLKITLNNQIVIVKGPRKITLNLNAIDNVSIIDTYPTVKSKQNGFSLGKYKRGLFTFNNGTSGYLFLESDNPPFLKITSSFNKVIYLNYNPKNEVQKKLIEKTSLITQ